MAEHPRVLILASAHSYRMDSFLAAAERMGVVALRGLDVPPAHGGLGQNVLGLDLREIPRSLRVIQALAARAPVQAVIATDDATVPLAAAAAQSLGLAHNSAQAAEASRNKHRMRQMLSQAGIASPWFRLVGPDDDVQAAAAGVEYPCVLKPTCLSGSRGVIRANNAAEFSAALRRIRAMLSGAGLREILVEGYIPGREYALEGIMSRDGLKVLALFDKPDPLVGPYFEETLYVTPSRAAPEVQAALADCAERSAHALGLRAGPVHAEMRVNAEGVWLVEIAGRSIGGLCSRILRFAHSADVSLEELILRQALGMPIDALHLAPGAGGVMMIPIPAAGVLTGIHGLDAARAIAGVEDVEITARLNYPLVPLPEGESYLGFIFARGSAPEHVEELLRTAHACLTFDIEPQLEMLPTAH